MFINVYVLRLMKLIIYLKIWVGIICVINIEWNMLKLSECGIFVFLVVYIV